MLRFASVLAKSLASSVHRVSYHHRHHRHHRTLKRSTGEHHYRSCPCLLHTKAMTLNKHSAETSTEEPPYAMDTSTALSSHSTPIHPPQSVKGMINLDRAAFQSKFTVPCVTVDSSALNATFKRLKKHLLKLQKFQVVREAEGEDSGKKEILLNPSLVTCFEDVKQHLADDDWGGGRVEFGRREISVGYENYKFEDIFRAVLPSDQSQVQSYSKIGHIIHLNLREHLLPYKTLIGQVYLDKIPHISMVVNKLNSIDSTYRNFQMETLAGEGDTLVTVKENGCTYEMDFARVYWNPRLSTEHERVAGKMRHGDVLYDVMAGVGPFAIPAGRRKCHVLANDLNPDSYEALARNCVRNKVADRVECFNMDGREFIRTVVRADLIRRWSDPDFIGAIHVGMNLPATAVTFLPSFQGLVCGVEAAKEGVVQLPVVHVYMFTKEIDEDAAIALVAENLGYSSKPCLGDLKSSGDEQFSKRSGSGGDGGGELGSGDGGNGSGSGDGGELGSGDVVLQCDGGGSSGSGSGSGESESGSGCGDSESRDVKTGDTRSYESLKRHIEEVVHVRQVAPNKAMMRVSFKMPMEVLLQDHNQQPPPSKKLKAS